MPYGPTNAQPFFACIMEDLNFNLEKVFIEQLQTMGEIGWEPFALIENKTIIIRYTKLQKSIILIIYDILLWDSHT